MNILDIEGNNAAVQCKCGQVNIFSTFLHYKRKKLCRNCEQQVIITAEEFNQAKEIIRK